MICATFETGIFIKHKCRSSKFFELFRLVHISIQVCEAPPALDLQQTTFRAKSKYKKSRYGPLQLQIWFTGRIGQTH